MITEGKWIFRDCPQKPGHRDLAVGNTTIACCEFLGQEPVKQDNARLIAAAPILLEACNSALGGLGHFLIPKTAKVGDKVSIDSRYADLLERLKAAIAEAKSTTQASS